MTADRRFEQQLPGALADLATTAYPEYIEDVLAITARTPRRPAWQFPSRWLPIEPAFGAAGARVRQLRPAAVFALVVLLIAALIAIYVGSGRKPEPFGLARNGQIAYSADHEAYVLDPNGMTRLLLQGPGDEVGLTYSLDGTRISFIRLIDDKEYLWAADADGRNQIQLIDEPLDSPSGLVWSADSRRIAIGPNLDGTQRIVIVEADGSGSRILDLPFPARDPAWRPPDGRELVVRGTIEGGPRGIHESIAHAQLFVVAADGSSPPREIGPPAKGLFFDDTWDHQGAAWSPDGLRLAYNSIDAAPGAHGYSPGADHADGLRFQVHIIEPDGTDHLIGGSDFNVMESWPAWSPDGALIAIERWKWDGGAWLAILPADGSGPGLDVQLPTAFEPAKGWAFTWAPDGTRLLAFYDERVGVVSIDVNSGAYEELDWPITDRPAWQRKAP